MSEEKRGRGRPRNTQAMARKNLYLPLVTVKKLELLARLRGTNESSVMRGMIDRELVASDQ